MDADKLMLSISLAQNEPDKALAQWAADRERRISEGDALNRIQPGNNPGRFQAQP